MQSLMFRAAPGRAGLQDVGEDAESAFDDSDYEDEFPVTRLYPSPVPPPSRVGAKGRAVVARPAEGVPPPSRRAEQQLRPADFTLPTGAPINRELLWKVLDGGGSLPPPPSLDNISLSTLADSCLDSVLDRPPLAGEVRAAPVSTSERLMLNSQLLCATYFPDIDGIVEHLDRLELDEQAYCQGFDHLVELFPQLQFIKDAAASHQLPKPQPTWDPKHDSLENVLRGVGEDMYRTAPANVIPWLDSVQEPSAFTFRPKLSSPESNTESSAPPFTFHPDEFVSTPQRSEDEPVKRSGEVTRPPRIGLLTCFGRARPPSENREDDRDDDISCDHESSKFSSDRPSDSDGGSSSASSYYSDENLVNIGDYAAEQLFGPDWEGVLPLTHLKEAARKFIDEMVALRKDAEDALLVTSLSGGNSHSGEQPFDSSSGGSSRKRKADGTAGSGPNRRSDGNEGQDEEPFGSRGNGKGGANGGSGTTAADLKENQRLEFMCPFRLKDPMRFNVREWYDCATKSYICDGPASKRNELNELRYDHFDSVAISLSHLII